ncbi:amino acid permease [Flavobacterium sp. FPG59]|nr:DUF3810 domain-containing protein [Flavobacterium sp. FPG59]OUD35910.1 amino acid permease [Flavobacterium sp. FPG59]
MKTKYFLPIFFLIQIILLQIAPFYPEQIERWYSNGMYPVLSQFLRTILGRIPFSIGDCLYFFLILCVLRWFWNNRKTWRSHWKNSLLNILSFTSVLYFLFHVLWALNYYREPLFEKMKIKKEYTDDDLLVFTKMIIAKTNAIQYDITTSKALKVSIPYTQEQIFKKSLNGYHAIAKKHSFFKFNTISTKKSLFSLPLTYMGFGGYLNPFTNEAQVNDLVPLYGFPMTVNHEMAHQMGYASESECNFIGFLASVENEDAYIQYSGYSMALRYCLGNWQIRDEGIYKQLLKTIHPGVLKNYKESEQFWKQYDTFIDKGFHAFYDQFLKINQQKDGMESYSKFVNLMVNYSKTHTL